jgi:hypothetical protein
VDTKITVIYDNPQDPGAFEAGYPEHLALAEAIPGGGRVLPERLRARDGRCAHRLRRGRDVHGDHRRSAVTPRGTARPGAGPPAALDRRIKPTNEES